MVTTPSPKQSGSPPHPAKMDPAAAVALRVTTVPELYVSEQSAPQEMPAGLLVTVPEPPPVFDTVSVFPGARLNIAVHACGPFMVTTPSPKQSGSPPHPAKM